MNTGFESVANRATVGMILVSLLAPSVGCNRVLGINEPVLQEAGTSAVVVDAAVSTGVDATKDQRPGEDGARGVAGNLEEPARDAGSAVNPPAGAGGVGAAGVARGSGGGGGDGEGATLTNSDGGLNDARERECAAGSTQCNGIQPQLCSMAGAWQNLGAVCQPCTACVATDGTCTPLSGTPCTDDNACTNTDTCSNGVCVGSNAVVCAAPDQCHFAGACDAASGTCSNPARPDNASCNDSSGCTQTDVCKDGVCTHGPAMTCNAPDQCHTGPGSCNIATGTCTYAEKSDGTLCNADGSLCTQNDTCRAGVCTPGARVTCSGPGQCHMLPGSCNPVDGSCSYMAKSEGSSCDADRNACTQNDFCRNGTCVAGPAMTCTSPPNQCRISPGICTNGTCNYSMKAERTACDLDANACTKDLCKSGVCSMDTTTTCPAPGVCKTAVACDIKTGICPAPGNKASGASDGGCVASTTNCIAGGCDGAGACLLAKAGTDCGICRACSGVGTCATSYQGLNDPSGCSGACQFCANGSCVSNTSTTCYQDLDGDGYGNPAISFSNCGQCPKGAVTDKRDCNDTLLDGVGVHPDQTAWFSVPNTVTGYDYDCSGMSEPQINQAGPSNCGTRDAVCVVENGGCVARCTNSNSASNPACEGACSVRDQPPCGAQISTDSISCSNNCQPVGFGNGTGITQSCH